MSVFCLHHLAVAAALVTGASTPAPAQCAPNIKRNAEGDQPILVTTAWVADHLKDPKLVLLQVGDGSDYTAAHIAGARPIGLHDLATPMMSKPVLELPAVDQLDSVLADKGISDDSRVVVYFGKDWVTPTARIFLTLEWAGLRGRVSIMDGGLPAWQAERRPVTLEATPAGHGRFTPHLRDDVVVKADWVRSHLKTPGVTLLDARDPKSYSSPTKTEGELAGHIPGAANVPYGTLFSEDNRLLPPDSLKAIFQRAGVKPGDTVVGYCHIGQWASTVYFAARLLGYPARLYDGSFTEWSTLANAPTEN